MGLPEMVILICSPPLPRPKKDCPFLYILGVYIIIIFY
jgi:hypothetical protein